MGCMPTEVLSQCSLPEAGEPGSLSNITCTCCASDLSWVRVTSENLTAAIIVMLLDYSNNVMYSFSKELLGTPPNYFGIWMTEKTLK